MGRGGGGGGGKRGGGGRAGRSQLVAGGPGAPLQRPPVAGSNEPVIEVRERYGKRLEVTQPIADAERLAMENPDLQKLSAYDDIQLNGPNRVVDSKGNVQVGDLGAPTVKPKMTNAEAMKAFEKMGMPRNDAYRNISASGDAAALIELFPKGSKYLDEGVEGVGIALPGGATVLRIQHGGGQPLFKQNVGPVGVYSDWLAKYGNTWVEASEAVAMQAKYYGAGKKVNAGVQGAQRMSEIKSNMFANIKKAGIKGMQDADAHEGNWGIDYKGRARVFDAGAIRNDGRNVAVWYGGGPGVKNIFTYTNKVQK